MYSFFLQVFHNFAFNDANLVLLNSDRFFQCCLFLLWILLSGHSTTEYVTSQLMTKFKHVISVLFVGVSEITKQFTRRRRNGCYQSGINLCCFNFFLLIPTKTGYTKIRSQVDDANSTIDIYFMGSCQRVNVFSLY